MGDLELTLGRKVFNEIYVYSFYNFAKFNEFTIGYYNNELNDDMGNNHIPLQVISLIDWHKKLFIFDQRGIFLYDNIDIHYQFYKNKLTLTQPMIKFEPLYVFNVKCITEGNVLLNCIIKFQYINDYKMLKNEIQLDSVGFYLQKQRNGSLSKIISNRERHVMQITKLTDFI